MSAPVDDAERARPVAPPPAIFAAAFALGFLLELLSPLDPAAGLRERVLLAALPLAAGLALVGAAFAALRRHGTTPHPMGTASALATTGVYAHTRNPMYLGVAATYAGVATLLACLWCLFLLPVALATLHHGVVRAEERHLAARFGGAYLDYARRVRRWI